MSQHFEETDKLRVDVGTVEVYLDLHYPITVGKGENARTISRLRFRRPNLNALEAVERVARDGGQTTVAKEICKQIGEDADNPGAVLVPSVIGQIDVADFIAIARETEVLFPHLKEKAA